MPGPDCLSVCIAGITSCCMHDFGVACQTAGRESVAPQPAGCSWCHGSSRQAALRHSNPGARNTVITYLALAQALVLKGPSGGTITGGLSILLELVCIAIHPDLHAPSSTHTHRYFLWPNFPKCDHPAMPVLGDCSGGWSFNNSARKKSHTHTSLTSSLHSTAATCADGHSHAAFAPSLRSLRTQSVAPYGAAAVGDNWSPLTTLPAGPAGPGGALSRSSLAADSPPTSPPRTACEMRGDIPSLRSLALSDVDVSQLGLHASWD
jgi:hypothetical protein